MTEANAQTSSQAGDTRAGRSRGRHRGVHRGRGARGSTHGLGPARPLDSTASATAPSHTTSQDQERADTAGPEPPKVSPEAIRGRRAGQRRATAHMRGHGGISGRGRGHPRGQIAQDHLGRGSARHRGRHHAGHHAGSRESILQADAPEFTPGTSVQTGRRDSTLLSTAPDIATRTHENIRNGLYECLICMNEVLPASKIWSCHTCWKVFHLSCIKKWSHNEGSALAQQRRNDEDVATARQWRCPGCNLPKDHKPSLYQCWCGKEEEPRPVPGLHPHSCGQSCSKSRSVPKDCPHSCDQQCHAGPCPPCTYMGPEVVCFCGKHVSRKRCIETDYTQSWSCHEACGDLMPCGEHTCTRPCHEGLCGACEVKIQSWCFCGKESKEIICNDKEEGSHSELISGSTTKSWIGLFNCKNVCGRKFDCEEHECRKLCHPQDLRIAHCPQSPDVITHCHCGKATLETLGLKRENCKNPIPSCGNQCDKRLDCGHECKKPCHDGWCPPCSERVNITCRCGRVTIGTVCHQGATESPLCMRTCKALLNCGRHDCGEHCCSGERKAAERSASKRKLRPLGASGRLLDESIEAEHICTRICGRKLKCENHSCPELCHKGPCGACREAIFDEISCHCGKTVLSPPLPCGTQPPPCSFDCERSKACGHPQIQHNCHGDSLECPKCPYLVEKPCMCGKKTLKNQKCWLADVRCGEICRKKLRCGSHICRKPCHRPGECEDAEKHCEQQCGKEKRYCGHPCEERCHAPSTCKEEKPCQSKFLITCECQHLKTETKCLASRVSDGNRLKTLKCDDECARLQRNHQLALALNIDPATHTDDHVPYSTQTLNFYQEYTKWAQVQERDMRIFAADETAKRLRCKPMASQYRGFFHSLAEDFGFDSESLDPEPHRHVLILKTPRFVKAPMKTLAECVRIRAANSSAAPAATRGSLAARLEAPNDLFNGFLLTSPRFGLTIDELRAELTTALSVASTLTFDIAFLPSEEIVLKAKPSSPTTTITPPSLEAAVKSLKSNLSSSVAARNLAASVSLCSLDTSLNILRRESDEKGVESGWSQVAAKAAGPKLAPRLEGLGTKSSFMVLGRKKKAEEWNKKEDVVEDWEEAMNEEEKERVQGLREEYANQSVADSR